MLCCVHPRAAPLFPCPMLEASLTQRKRKKKKAKAKQKREEKRRGFESQVQRSDFSVDALEGDPAQGTRGAVGQNEFQGYLETSMIYPLPSPTDNRELANPHQAQPRRHRCSGILSPSRGTNHHVQSKFQGWGQRPPPVSDPSGAPRAISWT